MFFVIVEYYPYDGHPGLDFESRNLTHDEVHRFVQRVHERAAAAGITLAAVYVAQCGFECGRGPLPIPYREFV